LFAVVHFPLHIFVLWAERKARVPDRVRFGEFELDLQSGELGSADGTGDRPQSRIVLPQQPFRLILMLIERDGAMVTRDEIQNRFWPNDTVVEFDHSINVAIGKLRKALGDSAEKPQYIATIARRGYRLMVPVTRIVDEDSQTDVAAPASAGGAEPWFQTAALLTGQTVSHYVVLDIIGGGGMGLVYRAEDLKLGRRVAIKFLPDETATDALTVQRFEREAQTASSLNHPNICTIYEFGEHKGQPFLVMELLQGETLRDRLAAANGTALSQDELLEIALQVSRGLQAAHEQGIIHRDIKPANIFLADHSMCKILDFGLAKMLERSEPDTATYPVARDLQPNSPVEGRLSRVGLIMGTASYMSPEQARAEKLDPRTDLFSFGAVLYEMATGQLPFRGDSAAAIFDAILNYAPVSPIRLNPDLPPALEQIINRALEKDPELRYQSAAEMRSDLQRLKRDTESGKTIAAAPDAATGAPDNGSHAAPLPSRSSSSVATLASSGTSRSGKVRKVLVPAAMILIVAAIAGGLYLRSRQTTSRLGEKDSIVLADFTNTTGDPIFDGTLRQGLAAQLEQSPFLNLLSDQRVSQTLALMTQPKDLRLTREVAREVCQRTASAATIEGSISNLGSQYVVGLEAVNCRNGDVLASEQDTAASKERVLKALGEAATKIREKLGESLASVEKYDAPPENVTTSSLEALRAYSLGYRAHIVKGDNTPAILLFQQAIRLDPNFAMAYAHLGQTCNNLGLTARAAENIRKAYELRERVGEREKFYITSRYEQLVTGNLEEMRKTSELWAQTYPRDGFPLALLQGVYREWGQYDKALMAIQQAVKLSPGNAFYYSNLTLGYLQVNRLDEARATAQEAQARNIDTPSLQYLYQIDFLQHDAAAMERDAALMGKSAEDEVLSDESSTAAFAGQFAKARELTQRSSELAQRSDKKEAAAGFEAEAALHESLAGNMAAAKLQANAALLLSNAKDVEALSAITLGLAGDLTQTSHLAADLAKRFPEDTHVRLFYLPMINAATALQSRNAGKALEALAPTSSYELGSIWWIPLYIVYLRGDSYLAAHQGPAAAAEFQKILDHPGIVVNDPIGALAHLGLARGNALAGDTVKAKAAYQDFLALWKNADPDAPILKQAQAEYAKLL
jgi:eukaryotic-like serine/threonine-protein kinase